MEQPIEKTQVETAKGIMDVEVFELETLTVLGITKHAVRVQAYDFLANRIISNYQGILGLDFFEGTSFTIDMVENTIEVVAISH